jgi:hypothetical protein
LLSGLDANLAQLLIVSDFTVKDAADAPADAQVVDDVKLALFMLKVMCVIVAG